MLSNDSIKMRQGLSLEAGMQRGNHFTPIALST